MNLKIWLDVKVQLQQLLNEYDFNTWISSLNGFEKDGVLFVICINKMIKNYVEKRFFSIIKDVCLELKLNVEIQIKLSSEVDIPTSKSKDIVKSEPTKVHKNDIQKTKSNIQGINSKLSISTTKQSVKKAVNSIQIFKGNATDKDVLEKQKMFKTKTFNNYVAGKSNSVAYKCAKRVAEIPGNETYNPLVLLGESGLGKTHLLWAIGNDICKKYPDLKVVYVTSTNFRKDFIDMLSLTSSSNQKNKKIEDLNQFYSSADVLLLDDIQLISNSEQTQEQIFNIFNSLFDKQKQMVITSDTIPSTLSGFPKRLKTRLTWGTSCTIEPPDFEDRFSITMSKAKEIKLDINQDIATYIARNFRTNIRSIEGALKNINVHKTFEKIDVMTLDDAKKALQSLLASETTYVSTDKIIKVVCEYFKVTEKDLKSDKRYRTVSLPRNLAMFIIREIHKKSFPEIAELFGGKHHTTVIHACKTMDKKIRDDKELESIYNNIMITINSNN